ncbi:MAG: J domain-containing protein [bacterium]|nr:J domain-containing protein [bacterium]
MASSGGYGSSTVYVDDREIGRLLGILELEQVEDLAALDRQYKRLIKQYHPDLNPRARDWAHDRSQAVITAARTLREYLERVGPLAAPLRRRPAARYSPRPAASPGAGTRPEKGAPGDAARRTPASGRNESSFQMIDGRRINYALPIKHIVKIIGVRDPGVHRGAPGPYCTMDGEIFPLHNLEGEDMPWEDAAFIVLLRSPLIRVGIVLPRDARFGGIESYRANELMRAGNSRNSHGVWIRHNMKFYLCPHELLPGFAAQPA